ncbi:MAG: cytochrome P450 [Gammaproteobacteria bacterium]|nr:cytochrome P450 [Gammaproteobacteria bacterium]MCP5200805.1 cytochrome P450 [Gammaproteobacteria bacterium]
MTAPPALPPGPTQHPALQLLRYSFTPLAFLEDCARRYGETFSFHLAGFPQMVMLTRPDDIRELFRGSPAVLHAGEGNRVLTALVGETSVLVLDDEPHARQRRALLPPLKGERMRQFFEAMQAEALATAQAWAGAGPVRADRAMQRVTLRVILRAVLGVDGGPAFDALETSIGRLLDVTRNPLALIMYTLFPPARFDGSRLLSFYRRRRVVDDALYHVIGTQRAQPAAARPPGLLSDLLELTYDDGLAMTDREIRDAVITILAAGHETTALSLAWALERVLAHPAVLTHIEAELDTVCGSGLPGPEHLDRLVYLDACIRESLRARTILALVVRVLKDHFTVGGFTYPPGVVLCAAIHLLHQRPDLYPEPQAFRPERFLERRFAPHEWDPFGGGNRACLGQAFALYEMKVVLATLFKTLALARPPGAVSRPVRRGIAIGPSDGCVVVATRK